MNKKKSAKKGFWQRSTNILLLFTNILCIVLLICSGYAQAINPHQHHWLVSLGLFFPFILFLNGIFAVIWFFRKRKFLFFVLSAFVICFIPIRTYIPFNLKHTVPEGSIHILSYNVMGYPHTPEGTLHDLLYYIGHSNADIVCTQESNYFTDNKWSISVDSLNHRWAYRDSIHFGMTNGMEILSNFPILSKQLIKGADAGHGAMACKIKIGADTILVINCHFASNGMEPKDKKMFKTLVKEPGNDSTKSASTYLIQKIDAAGLRRAQQVDSLVKYLEHVGDIPIILCGDFNDSPLSYTHWELTKHLNDAYTRSGNGPGISYHESGMYFRLDNILYSSHWESYQAKVDSHIKSSDHYPISCWLKLKEK